MPSGKGGASHAWSPGSFAWLSTYFGLNLALTIYNKLVLAGGFPFPYALTAIHCMFGTAGCSFCLQRGMFMTARLSSTEHIIIFWFSWLYTVNIIVSNVSLYSSVSDTANAIESSLLFHSIKSFGRRVLFSSLPYQFSSIQSHIPCKPICLWPWYPIFCIVLINSRLFWGWPWLRPEITTLPFLASFSRSSARSLQL